MTEKPQAIRAGRITAVALPDREAMQRFAGELSARGYSVRETPHFMSCRRLVNSDRVVVLHAFNEATIDEDVAEMIVEELGSLGIMASAQDYSDTHRALVASASAPSQTRGGTQLDLVAAWRQYCLNTIRRLRTLLSGEAGSSDASVSHVVQFAGIYRRIIECCEGGSLLDVGSSLGFLPMLIAERFPTMSVVGCDNRYDAVACAREVAIAIGTDRVAFQLKDVLASDFSDIGKFDTVTAVHLLEHLPETDLPDALSHLLSVAAKRLIISVPYEERPQPLYGHEQAFSPAKLDHWGNWCVDALGGGHHWYEYVSGGLLVVDLPQSEGGAAASGPALP